ncbi:hypothetical protein [Rubripirellula reticaptiva]|uniref:hypothetical protein n=1 Tax=Rubripirellula reticaptiva TaxID=2528013 RepID=UPI001644E0F4|nr:hypothetical protein [Rubripirellula reticaptiva]
MGDGKAEVHKKGSKKDWANSKHPPRRECKSFSVTRCRVHEYTDVITNGKHASPVSGYEPMCMIVYFVFDFGPSVFPLRFTVFGDDDSVNHNGVPQALSPIAFVENRERSDAKSNGNNQECDDKD